MLYFPFKKLLLGEKCNSFSRNKNVFDLLSRSNSSSHLLAQYVERRQSAGTCFVQKRQFFFSGSSSHRKRAQDRRCHRMCSDLKQAACFHFPAIALCSRDIRFRAVFFRLRLNEPHRVTPAVRVRSKEPTCAPSPPRDRMFV